MGATVLLCDRCTRRPHSFTDELVAAVTPTIDLVRAPRPNSGPGLFAAPHGRRGDYQAAQA
ncbi:MAG TPA: hypothetical protein VFI23_02080 [Rhizomicrobium sp.]|nr:hypothetical protein [Rhizomicrobium sp.]